MTTALFNLLGAMGQTQGLPPSDLPLALCALPPVGSLPLPGTTWLGCGLFKYRERQKWAREFVRQHIPQAIPPTRELCQRFQPVELPVPGKPGWKVTLECGFKFGHLTNCATGERITIDISKQEREPLMFLRWPSTDEGAGVSWEPAERLPEMRPLGMDLLYAIDDLRDAGVLRGVDYDRTPDDSGEPTAYHFSEPAAAADCVILPFCARWEDPQQRLWLAAAVGDWPLAHELATAKGDAELMAVTKPRAAACEQLVAARAKANKFSVPWLNCGETAPACD